MDAMQDGSAVVSHKVWVCCMDEANEVVNIDFQETRDFFPLDWVGEVNIFEDWLEEAWCNVIHH